MPDGVGIQALVFRRHEALCRVGTTAKKVVFHLTSQVLTRAGIGQIQAVLVDQHGLVLELGCPGLLGNIFPNPLAEFARIGRKIQPICFPTELHAFHCSCHFITPFKIVLIDYISK